MKRKSQIKIDAYGNKISNKNMEPTWKINHIYLN